MTDSQFSPKQIEANRRNAARSSGPATPQGKAVARMNAAKHGVLARQTLIPGEDAEELAELETALARQLRPAGATEEELFGEIVSGFWRLRRLRQAEAAVFAEELRGQRRRSSKSSDAADPRPHGIDRATIELGAAFQAACDTLGRLDRYETSILHRTKLALAELKRMRTAREEEQDWEAQAGAVGVVNWPD
jgi:hypothetical protein